MNEMSFRILYFVLALYLFTGCNPDVKMQLEEAKVLLEENPDSAYLYLQSGVKSDVCCINNNIMENEKDKK